MLTAFRAFGERLEGVKTLLTMTHVARPSRTARRAMQTLGALAFIAVVAAPAPPVEATQRVAAVKPVPLVKPAPKATGYVVKRALVIDEPIVHGFWKWDDAGVPDGRIIITVDTKAQTMSVFRDGYEIGVAVILYGADWKPTPTGVYPITQKREHHVSNLYDAPMPYMQRLTNDGIAVHASDVREGYATHGCIGVPKAFAKKLFETTRLGDVVIITNGETLKVGEAIEAASKV